MLAITAFGSNALENNTTGGNNTAVGFQALLDNQTTGNNTAVGYQALLHNTKDFCTAVGSGALQNSNNSWNTATGYNALNGNTTGDHNSAFGSNALFSLVSGSDNTAVGADALFSEQTGFNNTAVGIGALNHENGGLENTAIGVWALYNNTTGGGTAIGAYALQNNTTGNGNIAIGALAGANLTTGNDNIDIDNDGVAGESSTIRIGMPGTHTATYIAGIFGVTTPGGTAVYINSNGQLGTAPSSRRFKEEIKPMSKASEPLFALEPVTFRYKKEIDSAGTSQFGLVAEQVAQVDPDLVVRDKEGKPYSVRYDQVNAMLLNEFLKEHRKVEAQETTIAELKAGLKSLTATLEEQASEIQKVSAQLELSKSAPRTVLNNQ